jgi:hypothetical protein
LTDANPADQEPTVCQREKCQKELTDEDKGTKVPYCKACFEKYRIVLRTMHLVTEDTNPEMSVVGFEDLFEKVLFALFKGSDVQDFVKLSDEACKSW